MTEQTATDEGAALKTGGSKRPAAFAVLGLFALAFAASHAPVWGARLLVSDALWPRLVAWELSFGLMLLLPILIARWKPLTAAFNVRWLPAPAIDYWWALALLVLFAAIVAACSHLAHHWGWPRYVRSGSMAIELIPLAVVVLSALTMILVGPIVEEFFWRGYALAQFTKIMPAYAAIVIQAGLWSVVHEYPIGQSVTVFIQGVILGWWRVRRRSLLPLIVAHILLNAVAVGPGVVRGYRFQQTLAGWLRDPSMTRMATDMIETNRRGRRSPQGAEIDRLTRRSAANAVPKLIRFLGDADQDVRTYARVAISVQYAERACRYLDQALDSDDAEFVAEVISVVGKAGCRDLASRVRQIVMDSSNSEVQTAGILALFDLGDVETLRELASTHPIERIRDSARKNAAFLAIMKEDAP